MENPAQTGLGINETSVPQDEGMKVLPPGQFC
jgi:hypothetical protein